MRAGREDLTPNTVPFRYKMQLFIKYIHRAVTTAVLIGPIIPLRGIWNLLEPKKS